MVKLTTGEKQQLILENEKRFARRVAVKVVDKPVLSLWMILIPIFFVFYFFKYRRYTRGLEEFSRNFLLSRERALQEAVESCDRGQPADIDKLITMADDIPPETHPLYGAWMSIQVDHYHHLLSARGNSYAGLVRSFYKKKSSYLIFCNRLNKAEQAFDGGLFPFLEGDAGGIKAIINKMEESSAALRRQEAEQVFG